MARPTIESLQQQINHLSATVVSLENQLAAKEKTILEKENTLRYQRELSEKATFEVFQLHAAFDGIPTAPSKRYSAENSYGGTEIFERSALARFVGFLANKGEK